ncbi:MAG: biotin-dependent carboxyltransferase family protein [Candidimonas sp.]
MSIQVIKPGVLSQFQDLGRIGFQHLGVPVGGPMDEVSHRLANLAVGNDEGAATLEITMMGPTLQFERDALIAWAGAEFAVSSEAGWIAPLTPHRVRAGEMVSFGARRHGLRAYLAVAGGYGLQSFMGSQSTNMRVGLGGHAGRALRKGDRIELAPEPESMRPRDVARWIGQHPESRLFLDSCAERADSIRVLPGREWAQFTEEARALLTQSAFRLSPHSDRMGYRLEGAVLQRSDMADILSESVGFGTMQVPPDGQPIVLMADRQSVGGYPRIAQVAAVDWPRLTQAFPGDPLTFSLIDLDAAQHLLLVRSRWLRAVAETA